MIPRPMDTADFRDLVERNAYRPNIRWIAHAASNIHSPPGTCTLLAGAWLPTVKSESDYGKTVNDDHVGAWLIPTPQIPEHSQHRGRYIMHRGWKGLLQILIRNRVIRTSPEIVALFGDEWDSFRKDIRIGCL